MHPSVSASKSGGDSLVLQMSKRCKVEVLGPTRGDRGPARSKADFFGVKVFQEFAGLELIEKFRFDDIRRF